MIIRDLQGNFHEIKGDVENYVRDPVATESVLPTTDIEGCLRLVQDVNQYYVMINNNGTLEWMSVSGDKLDKQPPAWNASLPFDNALNLNGEWIINSADSEGDGNTWPDGVSRGILRQYHTDDENYTVFQSLTTLNGAIWTRKYVEDSTDWTDWTLVSGNMDGKLDKKHGTSNTTQNYNDPKYLVSDEWNEFFVIPGGDESRSMLLRTWEAGKNAGRNMIWQLLIDTSTGRIWTRTGFDTDTWNTITWVEIGNQKLDKQPAPLNDDSGTPTDPGTLGESLASFSAIESTGIGDETGVVRTFNIDETHLMQSFLSTTYENDKGANFYVRYGTKSGTTITWAEWVQVSGSGGGGGEGLRHGVYSGQLNGGESNKGSWKIARITLADDIGQNDYYEYRFLIGGCLNVNGSDLDIAGSIIVYKDTSGNPAIRLIDETGLPRWNYMNFIDFGNAFSVGILDSDSNAIDLIVAGCSRSYIDVVPIQGIRCDVSAVFVDSASDSYSYQTTEGADFINLADYYPRSKKANASTTFGGILETYQANAIASIKEGTIITVGTPSDYVWVDSSAKTSYSAIVVYTVTYTNTYKAVGTLTEFTPDGPIAWAFTMSGSNLSGTPNFSRLN
jgi:hypothetical protein